MQWVGAQIWGERRRGEQARSQSAAETEIEMIIRISAFTRRICKCSYWINYFFWIALHPRLLLLSSRLSSSPHYLFSLWILITPSQATGYNYSPKFHTELGSLLFLCPSYLEYSLVNSHFSNEFSLTHLYHLCLVYFFLHCKWGLSQCTQESN